jgi:hypothetical protein
MTRLRPVLAPLTALWLVGQIGTVMLVPVALWITAADPHAAECTCGHDDGAACPMHHKPTGESTPCAMRPANSSGAAIMAASATIVGLVPNSALAIEPTDPAKRLVRIDVRAADRRPIPPDPPPPRL